MTVGEAINLLQAMPRDYRLLIVSPPGYDGVRVAHPIRKVEIGRQRGLSWGDGWCFVTDGLSSLKPGQQPDSVGLIY